jgi:hypothetical protein
VDKLYILTPLLVLLASVACHKTDKNARLAEYLEQEKQLRDNIQDSTVLEDSLTELRERFSIDIQEELSRLQKNPQDWPGLLRKLRGG